MGFLELLSVASYPVMKVLLITAIGVFLALDNIDVLGADARKKVNNVSPEMFEKSSSFNFFSPDFCLLFADNSAVSVTACVLCV